MENVTVEGATWIVVHEAAFTRRKLARMSQVPGTRAQTFQASYVKFDRVKFEASCDFHCSTCMKRLREHSQHLIRASLLTWRKRGFMGLAAHI
jgi:hypothetical protein